MITSEKYSISVGNIEKYRSPFKKKKANKNRNEKK